MNDLKIKLVKIELAHLNEINELIEEIISVMANGENEMLESQLWGLKEQRKNKIKRIFEIIEAS